jgi:hypothetical protein
MKDFFVSFNSADKEWAEWISWTLEEAGYEVVFQLWDFRPGENFVLKMHSAAEGTRRTVLVLTDHYLKAEYTQPEWAAALVDDPRGERRKLIPLRVDPCQPSGLLKPLIYADLVGLTQEEARGAILTAVSDARPKPAKAPAFPGATRGALRSSSSPAPAFPGTLVTLSRGLRDGSPQSRALAVWKEKLAFLEEQEALASDASQKFSLKKQIEEARERIGEHQKGGV